MQEAKLPADIISPTSMEPEQKRIWLIISYSSEDIQMILSVTLLSQHGRSSAILTTNAECWGENKCYFETINREIESDQISQYSV